MEKTIDEIYNTYFYSLYGCNQALRETLNSYLPHTATCFYEYLLHRPLPYVGADSTKIIEETNDIYLLAPFARRIIEESRFVPDEKNPDKLVPVSKASHRHATMKFAMRCSKAAKLLYSIWNNSPGSHPSDGFISIHSWTKKDSELTQHMRSGNFCYALMDAFKPIQVKKSYHEQEAGSQESLRLLLSLFKIVFPAETVYESVPGLILPIASNRLFYGCIWVMFPGLPIKKPPLSKKTAICNTRCGIFRDAFLRAQPDPSGEGESIIHLLPKLLGLLHDQYLPVLALHHEWLSGNLFGLDAKREKDIELTKDTTSALSPIYRCPFNISGATSPYGENHPIEDNLFGLQKKRDNITDIKSVKKLNVFREYRVSSEGMLKLINSVIECAVPLGIAGKSLHAVLIVGGPGTGKESLADILAAFSKSYAHGARYTINMAALKPGSLTAFAVSGVALNGRPNNFEFDGLLASVRKARINELKSESDFRDDIKKDGQITSKWMEALKNREDYPMLVLDELNSMDHDAQGVLLRFLENAEIVPIGKTMDPLESSPELIIDDREKHKELRIMLSKFLVVGMMNEDPDMISREEAMEFITESKYLKGLVGDLLYEHVLKLRRLRPDIKYRMVRSGKLQIPLLCDRREDIPVLFHVYLNKAGESRPKGGKLISGFQLTLRAMSTLMDPTLHWPGNIRQLQALASRVSVIAYDGHDSRDGETCWVDRQQVEQGMAEIDMVRKNNN